MWKELLGALAIVLTFTAYVPYVRSILRGNTRPHVFSWIIWGLTTVLAFLAQGSGGAGVGAWPIGVSGTITLYIALLAYRHSGDTSITRTDWVFLLTAISALPVWAFTADPLGAVVILTAVDLAGFGPTFRLVYLHPYRERIGFFAWFVLRNALVILALERYTVTTVLFPAAVGCGCLMLIGWIVVCRQRTFRPVPPEGPR